MPAISRLFRTARRRGFSLVEVTIALGLLAADQAAKTLVRELIPLGHSVHVLPFFSLTHAQNTGAAFGIFPGANWLFVGLTFVILGFLFKMHRELVAQGPLARAGIPLLWGGALGNAVDRVWLGAVTDFLDVYWRGWHWPAFNVADSAISTGIVLLLAQHLFSPKTS